MNWDLNYGELAKDTDFVNKCENLKEDLMGVQRALDKLLPIKNLHYDKLSIEDKIELDLVLVYMLNSLQWVNLRIKGVDPTKHQVKKDLERIKATMVRWQEVKDSKRRPTVDLPAAKRFIKSGLLDHKGAPPQNKKILFEDSD